MKEDLGNVNALIVEPHSGMRGSMHNMLNLCGITNIDHAVSASTALRPLKTRPYDVILCEYDLGEGQDGQQLLEDLRQNKIIPLWAIFFMVTAERSYEKVVGAAELAPTDYLLKPFTAESLLERINRALDRRALFMPIYQLMDEGSLAQAIDLCVESGLANPRFSLDFMRLRAELHVALGQPAEAEAIYRQILEAKAIAWARLGLAKTLFMQNRFEEAQRLLQTLVSENRSFLDAYDWLAKTHVAKGAFPQAQGVLESAVAISPHGVRRLRQLGEVALETGDVALAESAFQKVVAKARYSEYRDPEDHVRLVKTLVHRGDLQQAAAVVRDLEKTLSDNGKAEACKAYSHALILEQNGDSETALSQLSAAVAASRRGTPLSNGIKLDMAKTCLENKLEGQASEMMLEVMNNTADASAMARAMKVFERAGRKELAETMARESKRQVMNMVTSGAEKAKQGDYRGAVELMTEAARKFPENPQVVFNAALSLLKCMENQGWDNRMAEQARWYIESCRQLDPGNPRLVPLSELYHSVLRKYGIAPSHVSARLRA
ncbi:MAG: response regulator [Burkholderiaceae bacterium]|nr:response regulator [Burkholderiaceae bacterium]